MPPAQDGVMYSRDGQPDSGISVAEMLLRGLREHINKTDPAQVDAHTGLSMSYRELLTQTVQAAVGWRALGMRRGDVVGVFSRNFHELFPAVMGATMAGCTVSCYVPSLNVAELRHVISLSHPKAIVSEAGNLATALEAAPDVLHVVLHGDAPPRGETYRGLVRRGAAVEPDPATYRPEHIPDRDDHVAFVLYSSGTTGLPKGVMLRDKGLTMLIENAEIWACQPNEKFLCSSPLSWISGVMILLMCTELGTTRVFMTHSDEYSILEAIQNHKINQWIGAPPVLVSMASVVRQRKYDLSSIKLVACGGAALTAQVQLDCMEALGFPIHQAYGSTESGLVLTSDKDNPKPGSIGRLGPWVQLKLVDVDTGKSLTEPYQVGEVRIKTPYYMKGYISNPEETARAFDRDGFYQTGDLVYQDEDGYFFFVDRIKEMLKYKSMQIAPAEVEGVLLEHPGVKEACVIGREDVRFGDLPTAFVVRAPGSTVSEEELKNLVAAKLSDHKQLRGGIIFMDNLPRTISGKTERKALKSILKEMPAPVIA